MSKHITLHIPARKYQDRDDCLAAAAADVAAERDLAGYDLSPRWEDDDTRETILVDIPAWATVTGEQIEALRAEAERAGDMGQVAICDRALSGELDDRAECARVIAHARAQEEV